MALKLALIGYGNMGKELAELAPQLDFEVIAAFDIDNPLSIDFDYHTVDVFIEFTQPDAVLDNIKMVANFAKPIVIGTTGWFQRLPEVTELVQSNKMPVIYAANFSIGMYLFFRIVEQSSGLFDKFSQYDPFIHEMHHRGKKDSPSGTALNLGKIMLDNIKRKSDLLPQTAGGVISPELLHVTSTRVGNNPSMHLVGFDSEADCIELKHSARSRKGFALGALYAARWIIGKKGIFTMDDLMQDLINIGT